MTRWRYIAAAAILTTQVDATTATPVFGQVLEVEPVFAPVSARVTRQHCWKERPLAATPPGGGPASTAAVDVRRRCTEVHTTQSRREKVGYRVKYRYRGRICRTQTERHPGQRIRVHHDLQPIHF